MSINSVVLVGRLARDVEFRTLPSGTGVVNNAIAVGHWRKDQNGQSQEHTSFIEISFFGRTAEVVNQYLRKGAQVAVTGRLEQQNWKDAQTGQNRSKLVVIVEQMQMLESKQAAQNPQNMSYADSDYSQDSFTPSYQTNKRENYSKPSYSQQENFSQQDNFSKQTSFSSSIEDDELPF